MPDVWLLPGEGVYSIASDSGDTLPSSSGNIRYAGLHKDDSPPESSVSLDTLYPNERLLTFNSNNNNKDRKQETGRLTRKAGETIPSSTTGGRSAGQAGDVWVIDARDLMGRGGHGDN